MSCSVHDLAAFETLGLPGVLVTTTAFVDAIGAQARTVGTDPRFVLLAHPIQDRTDEELHRLADGAIDAIVTQLTGAPAPRNQAPPPAATSRRSTG